MNVKRYGIYIEIEIDDLTDPKFTVESALSTRLNIKRFRLNNFHPVYSEWPEDKPLPKIQRPSLMQQLERDHNYDETD